MLIQTIILAAFCAGQERLEPVHAQNPVLSELLATGMEIGGTTIKLPPPRLFDGQTAAAHRAVVRSLTSYSRRVDEMLVDSVSAPFEMRFKDYKVKGASVRAGEVWFVIYGELKQIDLARESARAGQQPREGNDTRLETSILTPEEIRAAGVMPKFPPANQSVLYSHMSASMLDKVEFEATNMVAISQSPESVVIAARTDPAFDRAGTLGNFWKPLERNPEKARGVASAPYSGGMSYAKICRTDLKPGALLVEMHFAYVEPDGWFQGETALRSKLLKIAQNQVRALRKELRARKGAATKAPAG